MNMPIPQNIQDSSNPVVWTHAVHYVASAGLNGYEVLTKIDEEDKIIRHLLLTTKGRNSGQWKRTVLMFDYHEGNPFVLCSNGGKSDYPDWYKNIAKDGRVWVQIKDETFWADCEIVNNSNYPELRNYLIAKMEGVYPRYREFESMCPEREFPAIILRRVV